MYGSPEGSQSQRAGFSQSRNLELETEALSERAASLRSLSSFLLETMSLLQVVVQCPTTPLTLSILKRDWQDYRLIPRTFVLCALKTRHGLEEAPQYFLVSRSAKELWWALLQL